MTALTGSAWESAAGALFPLSLPPYLVFLTFASKADMDVFVAAVPQMTKSTPGADYCLQQGRPRLLVREFEYRN